MVNEENIDYELNKIAANIIKEKRLNKKYSLDDVVNRMDNIITKQSLYRYESNEARMKNGIFKKICLALGEDPSNVWNDINNRFIHRLQFDNAELVKYDPNDDNIAYIPILGTIKAGIPIEAQQNILEYVDGEYIITNPITENNLKEMRLNMDDTDLESFDNFVEKHWGNREKQTVQVSASVDTENTPKRRGRKPKTI